MKKYDFDIKESYLNEYFNKKNVSFLTGFSDSSISNIQNSAEFNNFNNLLKKIYFSENEQQITVKIDLLNKMLIDIDDLMNKKIIIKRDLYINPENFDFLINNFNFSENMFIKDTSGFISFISYSYLSDIFGIEHIEESFLNFNESSYFRVDESFNLKNDNLERSSFKSIFKKITSFLVKEYENVDNLKFLDLFFRNLIDYSESYRDIFKYTDINEIKFEKNANKEIIEKIKFHSDLLELSQDIDLKNSISGLKQLQHILNNKITHNLRIK